MIHKMYCVFARESLDKMKGNRGKMAAQAGHAFLHSYWDACTDMAKDGDRPKFSQAIRYQAGERAYKITLVVDTVEELKTLQGAYKDVCGTSLVTDAAFTVFDEPTTTCLGIGPISEANIGEDLKCLKTLL